MAKLMKWQSMKEYEDIDFLSMVVGGVRGGRMKG